MFITFEGIDGCGKTTQLQLLKEYLEDKGYQVVMIREPGGTDFSEKIRDILLYSKDNISPIAELMLFESARANLVENVIKPALAEGKIVLSDRFYDSTTAYQGYGRGLDLDKVKSCNIFATNGLKPDLTFYLEVPLNIAHTRSHKRVYDRIESAGDNFFQRVIDGFRAIAESEPERFVIIDSTDELEVTRQRILEEIMKRI